MARVTAFFDIVTPQIEIRRRFACDERGEKLFARRIAHRTGRRQQVIRVFVIALARMSGEAWCRENREQERGGEG